MWEALGWYGLLFSCLLSFSLGFLMVVWYVATQQAKRLLKAVPLQPVREKCELLQQETTPSAQKGMGSGSPRVDEELDKVVDLCLRDYLQSWYHPLVTGSTALLDEAKATSSLVVSTVSRRCQEPEFLPLFMEALVDILIGHFKLYKGALSQVTAEKSIEKCIKECDSEGWSVICAGGEAELVYLRGVTEYALNLILPSEDFSNPLFRSLAQDLIAEQILLPTAHYCTTSYYINSTVVSLTKDTSLTGESLLIALSRASTEEIALTLSLTAEEIKVLKKRGKTELDQLQLNSLTDLSNQLSQIQETGLREADEVKYKDHIPSLTVSIPEYRLVTEGRVKHVDYKIIVQCQHKQGPVEEWNTWRSFSDLHDLHLKLKETTQAADLPTLPSQTKAFNRLDPTFLEQKKQGMQIYLQSISSQEFLNSHLNLFEHIILFLTESSYIRHSTEIARTVDKLVQPLKRTKSDIGKVQITSPSSPALFHKSVLEEAEEEEEEEEEGVAILLTLLDEVFDVAADQWIQRQLSHLLRQLLGSMLSDKMGKRMMEALDNYASGDHIADLIGQLRTSLWPDGYRAESRQPPSPETLHLTSLLARTKLIGSVPDDLKRLLGSNTTHKGIIRLFDMFQHEKFNLQLLYRIVEALLCALFPERDLNHAFYYLRTQTLLKTNIR